MTKARGLELTLLAIVLAGQCVLLARLVHNATNYDEAVYLAALDALRHGQALGSDVFAAQLPGFYDLLRGLSFVTGVGVASVRAGLIAVTLLGTVGGWLVGRHYGGPAGGLLVAAFLTIAPPLDLFGSQVIADSPGLALTLFSLGLATLPATAAVVCAGAFFAGALSVKLTAVTALPVLVLLLGRRVWIAFAGAAVVTIVLVAAHARALGDLWAGGVTYHSRARSTPAVIPDPHDQIFRQIPHGTPFFVLSVFATAVAIALLVLRRRFTPWPLWMWVGLGLVFLFLHAPLHYNHLILFPFTLAVAAGATIGAALQFAPRGAAAAFSALLAAAVAAGWVQQLHRVDAARVAEPSSNLDAARALARVTAPASLVADDRPIIAFLADRRVVGPLVDMALLRFETDSLTDAAVERDLGSAQAVVASRVLRRRPSVMQFIGAHYRLRYARGGVRIYTRR